VTLPPPRAGHIHAAHLHGAAVIVRVQGCPTLAVGQ
jgi:hypothetical protein